MLTDDAIAGFAPISLAQMDVVRLMNRTDRKFWFNIDLLPDLLDDIAKDYYILEIDGVRNLPYSTAYYDTEHDEMYRNHHRGKMNRYKIRRRNYVSTNISFLEVKFKSNKGRTIKVRQPSDYASAEFSPNDNHFIEENTPYTSIDLKKVLENNFKRLMLVSRSLNERCTIDSELRFVSAGNEVRLDNLVVVEVKTDGRSRSTIIDALNRRRLKPSGFSKYCIGRSLADGDLLCNNFKRKHRELEKRINNPIINNVSV